jgi:hypothetical protein
MERGAQAPRLFHVERTSKDADMKKATVTYTAPPGEAKAVDIGGTMLVSGKADTVICDDALMERLKNHHMLKVDGVADYTPPPPKPEPQDDKKGKAA